MFLRAATRSLRAPLAASVNRKPTPRLLGPTTKCIAQYSSGQNTPRSRFSQPDSPKPNSKDAPLRSNAKADRAETEASSDTGKHYNDNAAPENTIPVTSLPDLTQGIPSTLEHETAGATNRQSLAPYEAAFSAGGKGKGDLPASAYISSTERRRQKLATFLFASSIGLGIAGTVYAGRDWDEEGAKKHAGVPNGWGLKLWWDRASTRTREFLTYFQEPAFEKLLPDPDPVYGRPYTLCLSLEDLLVHSEWSREHGWRLAKRPGVDYFIRYLSQYYEIVLFTSVPYMIAEPMIRKLDPYHFIVYPLFREATKYKDGEIVKDLSYLNRDLSKVIIIDTVASHVRDQPENAIILPKWTGEAKDTGLVDLVPFLEYTSVMEIGDVRKALKSFEGKSIPEEFARREAIARAKFQKQLESHGRKRSSQKEGGISALGSMLGLKSSNLSLMVPADGELSPVEQFAQGKMIQDIMRERGQKQYELMEKEIRENGEKWLKEDAAAQEKAQQEAVQSVKQGFAGWFIGPEKAAEEPKTTPTTTATTTPKSSQ